MSASREKKTRQGQTPDLSDPKTAREAQERKEASRSNRLYAVIAVVFVLVAIAGIVWRTNVIPKTATAVTINGEKYSAAEVDFYYESQYQQFLNDNYYILSYIGVDMNAPMKSQTISSTAAMFIQGATEGETWHDYLLDQTFRQMITVHAFNEAAAEEGFTWNDELQAELDEGLASVETNFNLSLKEYLNQVYGGMISEKLFIELNKEAMLSNAYAKAYEESLTYTDDELEAAYAESRSSYDVVSYKLATINGSVPPSEDKEAEVTDEMKAAAMAEAKATADRLYGDVKAGGDMQTLSQDIPAATYGAADNGDYASLASYTSSVVADWLFDDARTAGDTAVLEDKDAAACYVVTYEGRGRQEYETVDVRHILVMVDENGLNAEDDTYADQLKARKDDALAKAEEILAQWKSGEATEDSFAALADEKSEDGGSNTNGGLYERVVKGQMVPEFNDWCFDSARQSGDTGIVYGESNSYKGYHVMYFSGKNEPFWKLQVSSALTNNALTSWHEEAIAPYTAEPHSFALKFVG